LKVERQKEKVGRILHLELTYEGLKDKAIPSGEVSIKRFRAYL